MSAAPVVYIIYSHASARSPDLRLSPVTQELRYSQAGSNNARDVFISFIDGPPEHGPPRNPDPALRSCLPKRPRPPRLLQSSHSRVT
jgi:hypothetical protein